MRFAECPLFGENGAGTDVIWAIRIVRETGAFRWLRDSVSIPSPERIQRENVETRRPFRSGQTRLLGVSFRHTSQEFTLRPGSVIYGLFPGSRSGLKRGRACSARRARWRAWRRGPAWPIRDGESGRYSSFGASVGRTAVYWSEGSPRNSRRLIRSGRVDQASHSHGLTRGTGRCLG
jgi:hypothetical protein